MKSNPKASLDLALRHEFAGEFEKAEEVYRNLIKSFPRLSKAAARLKAIRSVRDDYEKARNIFPGLLQLLQQGRLDALVAASETAIKTYPKVLPLYDILATAQARLARFEDAIATYDRALKLAPDRADTHGNKGNVLLAAGNIAAAEASFRRVLDLRPNDPVALNNLGNALQAEGDLDGSEVCYRAALDAAPTYVAAWNNLGNILKDRGLFPPAQDAFERALSLSPTLAEAHWNLASVKRFSADDGQISAMEKLLSHTGLNDQDKMLLSFALGTAYDAIGLEAKAFSSFQTGNRLRKKNLGYSLDADRKLFAAIKQRPEIAADVAPLSAPQDAPRPVFIVGLPRSGTTLVEQIVSSHPKVHAGGEIGFLETHFGPLLSRPSEVAPEDLRAKAGRMGTDYLAMVTKAANGRDVMTDKLPLNFRWIGFILALFPNARIIHVERDARATCWSIYKHFFATTGNGYAHDLEDLVAYHALYKDLMSFWKAAHSDAILDVDYEQLTADPEPLTRAMIAHLGLDWDEACLSPEANQRVVRTSSATQVRRAVYQGSSQDWQRYLEWLEKPFKTL